MHPFHEVKWVLRTTAIHSCTLDASGTEEVFFCSPLSPPSQQNTQSWDNFQLHSQKHMSPGLDFLQQSATAGTVMSITNSWNPVWLVAWFLLFSIILPEDCWMQILDKSLTSYIHCPQHSHLQLIPSELFWASNKGPTQPIVQDAIACLSDIWILYDTGKLLNGASTSCSPEGNSRCRRCILIPTSFLTMIAVT